MEQRQGFRELPAGEQAAFELACERYGFAPTQFEITGFTEETDVAHGRFVTVRRYGGRAQSYHADCVGQWVREFEVDLTCRFFK
ncbi:hypothetical protein [Paraburkholderia sp. BL10I2N1]|jgi:hypothetical protein|uniref:hypothetical protein n=1 Tax=Paraburkholderia sp. BL10I2N1 TaxID=1938796 RepID=UPI00105DA212|nr:hypothetical protein [Paraburkholderia sp. BL10I2N1]TDN67379.1 hypothetical protein B0G77_0645 [Paraburkholderia sp. BL10I2N1]